MFKQRYPLSFSLCLMLFVGMARGSGSEDHQTFKAGKFKIKDWDTACANADQLIELKGRAPNLVENKKFCVAFLKLCALPKFSFKIYLKQVDKYQTKFIRCLNI